MGIDPVSLSLLSALSIASTVISTGIGVMGQIQEGKAAKAQANYQSAVARNNAIIAQRQADDARARGEIAERSQRQQTAQLIARQRAAGAAQGVVVGEGSLLDITSDTAALGELDALTVRSNAEREALGFEAQGMNFLAESDIQKTIGKNQSRASKFAAAGTLLSGASSVAGKWSTLSSKDPTGVKKFTGRTTLSRSTSSTPNYRYR